MRISRSQCQVNNNCINVIVDLDLQCLELTVNRFNRGAPENLVLFPCTLEYPTDAITQMSIFNARALQCLTTRRVNFGQMKMAKFS